MSDMEIALFRPALTIRYLILLCILPPSGVGIAGGATMRIEPLVQVAAAINDPASDSDERWTEAAAGPRGKGVLSNAQKSGGFFAV